MFRGAYIILKYNILDDLFDVYINQKYSILIAFKLLNFILMILKFKAKNLKFRQLHSRK